MNMAKDPICGMMVDEKKAKFKSDYNGKTYYFCAATCKTTFDKNSSKICWQLRNIRAQLRLWRTTAKPSELALTLFSFFDHLSFS